MKHIIISPVYYIDKQLVSAIVDSEEEEVIVVITDDVSPIFPLDIRENWLKRTIYGRKFDVDSIVQNDESEEFLEAAHAKIRMLEPDESKRRVTLFATEFAHENVKPLINHVIKNPLDKDVTGLFDSTFAARFHDEFSKFTQPKDKELPKTETVNLVPHFTFEDKDYIVLLYDYRSKNLGTIDVQFAYRCPIAEFTSYVVAFTKGYGLGDALSYRIIGGVDKETYVKVDIEAPTWFNLTDVDGLRQYFTRDADLIIIERNFLKNIDIPILHWLQNRLEEEEVINE